MKLMAFMKAGRHVPAALLLNFVFGTVVLAAEYKADIVQKIGGHTVNTQRLFVKDNMERSEMSVPTGKHIIIVRFDKRVEWILDPKAKTYTESSLPRNLNMSSRIKMAKSGKKIGTEAIKGYVCDKYRLDSFGKSSGSKFILNGTSWVSQKLNRVMRSELSIPGGTVIEEVQSVKEGKQPDSLFEIPKGYKKISAPAFSTFLPKHK